MTTLERLERLQGGPTRYELIAECGEQRILIKYCMRRSRSTLFSAIQKHGPALIALTGMTDDAYVEFLKPASKGAKIGDWSIRFSGRTQREAISTPLPWIGDKVAACDHAQA